MDDQSHPNCPPLPAAARTPQPDAGYRFDSDDQCDCDCDCACLLDGPVARLPLPLTYYLELTPDCNNRCPGCGNVFVDDKTARPLSARHPLDAAGWAAILAKIGGHAQRLKVTGGEPTLHPEFEPIIRLIVERSLPFTLFTNGRWDDPDRLVGFLHDLPQCLGLLISLHGSTAQAHEAFSGIRGCFAETCENIRRASAAGLQVAISTVFTRHNVDQLAGIVALARSLGARQVVFNRYLGLPVPAIAMTSAELREAVREVEQLRAAGANVKFGSCVPACFAPSSSRGCAAGAAFATIDPWGSVRPCNHAPLVVGNLIRQSVEEIWRSSGMDRWEALGPRQCGVCELFAACHGGCRAMALLLNAHKDPLIRRPFVRRSDRSSAAGAGTSDDHDGIKADHGQQQAELSGLHVMN
jgi:radical SAM protein with 4Fe4S-binding SPASM domain